MQCTINIYTQMKKSGLSMNKLIGKKEREQSKHRKNNRFGLEMVLANSQRCVIRYQSITLGEEEKN